MLADLTAALILLTRLPVGRLTGHDVPGDLTSAIWAFPLVGLLVGALGGAVYWLVSWLGSPPFLAACLTLAVMVWITGGFHEDGLADVTDGLGGGRTKEEKLAIMRDSRIGAYGALALVISSFFRVGAIATLARPYLVVSALIASCMLGRAGIVVPLGILKPARTDGIAAGISRPGPIRIFLGPALALSTTFALFPFKVALASSAVGAAACIAFTAIAQKQVGGYSGDILGAVESIVEITVLTVIASISTG
jgi:adenosylcobinamide-GDP ribazoletransferase